MSRQHIEFIDIRNMYREVLLNKGVPTAIQCSVLSSDSETGATSYYAHVPPHWFQPGAFELEVGVECLVLAGELRVGKAELRRGDYVSVTAGNTLAEIFSTTGCELILLFSGAPGFRRATPDSLADASEPVIVKTGEMPWARPPSFEGRTEEETPAGVFVKWLNQDPGAGAYTALVYQSPGWSDPLVESHETWEELLLLQGDYLMGRSGAVMAGTYIFRPKNVPHGPQATKKGSVWLARGEREIDFAYKEDVRAAEMIDRYLNSKLSLGESLPWGEWAH